MLTACWNVLVELAPWLLLGAAVAGLLHALVPPGFLRRQLQGRVGVAKAVVLGVPLPLCSCGVIPVGLSLKKMGASDGAVVAFLISTPQTGVDSILVSASLLGIPFAWFKVASAALTGWIGGMLTTWAGNGKTDTRSAVDGADPVDTSVTLSLDELAETDRSFRGSVAHGLELIRSIWRWLVVGIVVSALLQRYLPENGLARFVDYGVFWTMLATLVISLPLYVCATASVPIAAALVAGGLPTGAALVFLMAGPATNVATLGAVGRVLGRRTLAIYLATLIVGSVGLGMAFEALPLASEASHVAHDHVPGLWAIGSAVVLLGLFGWFAGQELRAAWRVWQARRRRTAGRAPDLVLPVAGMTCGNCTSRLQRALLEDKDVESAEVELSPGRAIIHGPIPRERAIRITKQAGFRPEP
jgi:uncharacterized membrane protein YraQ (UPF0718 family)/copper chaperone CopZ